MKENKNLEFEEFEGDYAKWHRYNGQRYLEVFATDFYEMGYLQGKFLARKIKGMKRVIEILGIRFTKVARKDSWEFDREYEEYIPDYLQAEMKGMADAINGISYRDILMQNCFIDLLHGQLFPIYFQSRFLLEYQFGCTVFGGVNKKDVILGQNFDFGVIFNPYTSYVLLKMPKKPDNFGFRIGGMLNLPPARNKDGITLAVNLVKTNDICNIGVPICILTRMALEKCKSTKDFMKFYENKSGTLGYNLSIADSLSIISYETTPDEKILHHIRDIFVRSNTYVSERLQKDLLRKKYSKKRQNYGETLVNDYFRKKKRLDEEDLIKILADKPIICRTNPLKSMTLSFFTKRFFGRGNLTRNKLGIIPIF